MHTPPLKIKRHIFVAIFLAMLPSTASLSWAVGPEPDAYEAVVSKAVNYLRTAQSTEGYYTGRDSIGVTALVTTSLLRSGISPDDPVVARSLKFLQGFVQQDGGIYPAGSKYRNYETCLAVLCFGEANRRRQYDDLLQRAAAFLKRDQWDQSEGVEIDDFRYGGSGYGSHARPDLSNTSFLVETLHSLGTSVDDEAMQRALHFVTQCQNHESGLNKAPFAAKNNDGGFYYTPASGGVSQAGQTPAGGLRSYGSMTYAGLKSMIYAGVGPDDRRVKAATEWIKKFYDLDTNPGMGAAGLFYYYQMFAKALDAIGADHFEDARGEKHDWRRELFEALARRQQPGGAWTNVENDRWLEGDANLVTGYALLALSYCRPK